MGRHGQRAGAAGPQVGRLAWLDALRGIGALAVAVHHCMSRYLPDTRRQVIEYVNLGTYGVLVFFLVSGFIIPASLSRAGSVRKFWLGRIFRIYPLLLAALAAFVVLLQLGLVPLRPDLVGRDLWSMAAAHLLMLNTLVDVPGALYVLWTLSFEMAFYLLVAALFTIRQSHRPGTAALTFTVLGLALGGVVQRSGLSAATSGTAVVVGASLVTVAAIAVPLFVKGLPAQIATVGGGVLAVVLVAGNSAYPTWQSLAIFAIMFAGTVVYRFDQGLIGPVKASAILGTVVGAAVLSGVWRIGQFMKSDPFVSQRVWALTTLAACHSFALAYFLRHRTPSRTLTHLGAISFSLYLLHPFLLWLSDNVLRWRKHDTPLLAIAYLIALVVLASLTHRHIEQPAQRLGRRLIRRPEPVPAPVAVPEPVLVRT